MFRTKVTISCLQVVLGLLQPLDPVLDLQINLRLLNMVPNDFSYPKTWGNTKIKSLASSEPKLQFHSLKSSLASNTSTLFLTLNLILGSWKWSQMIPHTQKHMDRHQKQVSSMFRSKVTVSLLEDVLGLLQPLHPVLVLQGSLKMVPNDSPWPKTWGLTPK